MPGWRFENCSTCRHVRSESCNSRASAEWMVLVSMEACLDGPRGLPFCCGVRDSVARLRRRDKQAIADGCQAWLDERAARGKRRCDRWRAPETADGLKHA